MIRKRTMRNVAVFMVINLLYEICFPAIAFALTGGPSQPEVQSFEPVGTTEMVDVSSGDFVYNIPLLDVEGYPINISYHSGITLDQEATWVGLGWNINPGVINRNMRGLPDDFNGDQITKKMYMKDNITYGANFGMSAELFGIDAAGKLKALKKISGNLSVSLGIFYNNYKGLGFERAVTPSISAGNKLKLKGSLGITSNTQTGTTISPSISLSASPEIKQISQQGTIGLSVSASFNNRSGVKSVNMSKDLSISSGGKIKSEKINEKNKDRKSYTGNYQNSSSMSNGGSVVSFSGQSYTPQITMPMTNLSKTGRGTVGGEVFGVSPSLFVTGYSTRQYVKQTELIKGGFGYLYSHEAKGREDVLHDVNREKDGSFTKDNPTLPITNYTYDLYSVSGQGIGGMYRPYRSELGLLHDDKMVSDGSSGSFGVEFGAGNAVKWGMDDNSNGMYTESGLWSASEGNGLMNVFNWVQKNEPNVPTTYEPVYFKATGEKTTVEKDLLAYKNLTHAIRPSFGTKYNLLLQKTLQPYIREDQFEASDSEGEKSNNHVNIIQSDKKFKTERAKRNMLISYRTAVEADFCFDKKIKDYPVNTGTSYNNTASEILRYDITNGVRKSAHHISEITTVNPGGARYIYGIPAYNNSQSEVTFAIDPDLSATNAADKLKQGIAYCKPTKLNQYISSAKGYEDDNRDGFYNSTTTPAFAHSYLLTAVLSPDYVDVTQNGISDDDLGTYTKINYSRVHSDFGWRVPYNASECSYSEGLKTLDDDNKGNIIYGTKEMWYVHSIESRNYVAVFELNDDVSERRLDGVAALEVFRSNNQQLDQRSRYLKAIRLYTKNEWVKANTINGYTPVPVKTVHFEYDYSLCPYTDNSIIDPTINPSGGKLTLKSIYFTYQGLNKGKYSRYKFSYSNHNYSYNLKANDRWGNYKAPASGSIPVNAEFPYVDQSSVTDEYAQAWSLNKIELPSGGTIDVEYESDDYAYVQDKRAMQMFEVYALNNVPAIPAEKSRLYYYSNLTYNHNNYVIIDVKKEISAFELFRDYLPEQYKPWDGTRYMFFNFLTNIISTNPNNKQEYVRGYAEIEEVNLLPEKIVNGKSQFIYIKVKKPDIEEDETFKVSPFAKAAWQYARLNTPHLVYPESKNLEKNPSNITTSVLKTLFGFMFDVFELFEDFNEKLQSQGKCSTVQLSHCWVRLTNPTMFKKGGGVRVKKIRLNDNWENMGGAASTDNASYGQEYDYTTVENGRVISSGVASYEPMVGNDENPWRQPVMYKKENALIPDDDFYTEEPFGETFFPSASVIYSKVTVKNLQHPGVTKHATGRTVNEFYTSKDFPTIVDRTGVQTYVDEPSWIEGLFSTEILTHVIAAQGYQIELNDMHGKPKATWVYEERTTASEGTELPISGTEYKYRTDANNPKRLDNRVDVIRSDGSVREELIGVDVDMVLDSREQISESSSSGVQLNSDMFIPVIGALKIPVPLPSMSEETSKFRTSIITRVINRYGILEKTIAHEGKAEISTINSAWDAETGEVLLTKTQNEFKDDLYNLTYPAHWVHDGMGPAYKNAELAIAIATNSEGYITSPSNVSQLLHEGDEAIYASNPGNNISKVWVHRDGTGYRLLSQFSPWAVSSNGVIKVIRSGRRNMQSLPSATFLSKKSPIYTVGGNRYVHDNNNTTAKITETKDILNSNSTVYSNYWKDQCNLVNDVEHVGYCFYDYEDFGEILDIINELLGSGTLDFNQVSNDPQNPSIINIPETNNAYNTSEIKSTRISTTYPHNIHVSLRDPLYDYPSELAFGIHFEMQPCAGDTSWPTFYYFGNSNFVGFEVSSFNSQYTTASQFLDDYKITRFSMEYVEGYRTISSTSVKIKAYCKRRDSANSAEEYLGETYTHIEMPPCYNDGTKSYVRQGCFYEKKPFSNPYLTGELGNWRKEREYLFLENRNYASSVRNDGNYTQFHAYWMLDKINSKWVSSTDPRWVWTTKTTEYDPKGMEIENKDPLERYNGAAFNKYLQPKFVVNNGRYYEGFFDDFEVEPNYTPNSSVCDLDQWKCPPSYDVGCVLLNSQESHSGFTSLKLENGNSAERRFGTDNNCGGTSFDVGVDCICLDCLRDFSPIAGKSYVVSGWLKVKSSNPANRDYSSARAEVEINCPGSQNPPVENIYSAGPIIDGWQRFEKKITLPANTNYIRLRLVAAPTPNTTLFDDIRVSPYNGNMKSFVYNLDNLKLMAELDENNYATFYEYDASGALLRVKKETEKGIATLKESRNSMVKKKLN